MEELYRDKLPAEYLDAMRELLGEEYPKFLASYEQPRRNGLRLNRLRISPEEFEACPPFPVSRIKWTQNGYYVDYRDHPGRHPWYNAGVYYLQEPSAMVSARLLDARPSDKVLDLCAAPGGKATELGACLQGQGLLVANEISASRAKALLRNLEQFGIRNVLVTNTSPEKLAQRFPEYFDKVLVDAPCSGEGMFRKDIECVKAWSEAKVKECARIQREIILQACDMLRPGGYMVYSTCTFAPEENELVLAHLLTLRPEMELQKIPCEGGMESFRPAFDVRFLEMKGYEIPQNISRDIDLTYAVRIWPHLSMGEGHFVSLLRKRADRVVELSGADADTESFRPEKKGAGRGKRAGGKNTGGKNAGGHSESAAMYVTQFLEQFLPEEKIDENRYDIRGNQVYLMPEEVPDVRGLSFLRCGLYLGELKKDRFEPSQALAMAFDTETLRADGRAEECCISFGAGDEMLAAFLRGEAVRPGKGCEGKGWRLVCVGKWPVGWGKLSGGVLKNKLLPGWRNSNA